MPLESSPFCQQAANLVQFFGSVNHAARVHFEIPPQDFIPSFQVVNTEEELVAPWQTRFILIQEMPESGNLICQEKANRMKPLLSVHDDQGLLLAVVVKVDFLSGLPPAHDELNIRDLLFGCPDMFPLKVGVEIKSGVFCPACDLSFQLIPGLIRPMGWETGKPVDVVKFQHSQSLPQIVPDVKGKLTSGTIWLRPPRGSVAGVRVRSRTPPAPAIRGKIVRDKEDGSSPR